MSGIVFLSQTGIQFAGKLFNAAIAFFTTLLLARSLGIALFGEYTQITAFILLSYLLIDFGMNTIYLREEEAQTMLLKKSLGNFIGLRLTIASLLFVSISFFSFFLPLNSNTHLAVILAASAVWGYALFLSAQAFFFSQSQFKLTVLCQVAGSLTSLLVVLLLPFTSLRSPIIIAAFAFSLGSWVSAAVSLFFLSKQGVSFLPAFSKPFLVNMLRASVPLGTVLFFNMVYVRADLFILGFYRGSVEAGSYALAYKFFDFAVAIPTFFMNSAYPLLLRKKNNPQKFHQLFSLVLTSLFFLSFVVLVVFWLSAALLPLIKSDYQTSVALLRILSLSLPIFYLTSPLMWLCIILKTQRVLVILYSLVLVLNIGANFYFIPQFGATAAAIITGLSEAIILIGGLVWYIRIQKKKYAV